jgi:hypothetical protein
MKKSVFTNVAIFLLAFLILLGLLVLTFIVPVLSLELTESYEEYSGDGLAIQVLLSAIIITGLIILGFTCLLLVRIKNQKLFVPANEKWVALLTLSLFLFAGSFIALFLWLGQQNTMPPILAIGLLGAAILSAAVGFVTLSLLGALQRAIEQNLELESVI